MSFGTKDKIIFAGIFLPIFFPDLTDVVFSYSSNAALCYLELNTLFKSTNNSCHFNVGKRLFLGYTIIQLKVAEMKVEVTILSYNDVFTVPTSFSYSLNFSKHTIAI